VHTVPTDADTRPVLAACEDCGGSGETSVFLYPTRPNLRGMEMSEVMYLAWHGSPRERTLAEKEIRRREVRKL
jgi:hypothetical protein